jgi:hypothetical protein
VDSGPLTGRQPASMRVSAALDGPVGVLLPPDARLLPTPDTGNPLHEGGTHGGCTAHPPGQCTGTCPGKSARSRPSPTLTSTGGLKST